MYFPFPPPDPPPPCLTHPPPPAGYTLNGLSGKQNVTENVLPGPLIMYKCPSTINISKMSILHQLQPQNVYNIGPGFHPDEKIKKSCFSVIHKEVK
jgi:hypothetical protein